MCSCYGRRSRNKTETNLLCFHFIITAPTFTQKWGQLFTFGSPCLQHDLESAKPVERLADENVFRKGGQIILFKGGRAVICVEVCDRKDDPVEIVVLVRIIERRQVLRRVFAEMRSIPKSEVISVRYEKETSEKKKRLSALRIELAEAQRRLDLLKGEIVKCLEGKSNFTSEVLSSLIADGENDINERKAVIADAEAELQRDEENLKRMSERYDKLISWSELYENATIEQKKMIVNSMITRIDVFSGYELNVEFAFDIRQFFEGIDSNILIA